MKPSVLFTAIITSFLLSNSVAGQVPKKNLLETQFLNPPIKARPYVWWHWMGSNFSKSGITKDLEAMKAMGIGGATIFNLSSAVQESHVPTLNNPWPEQSYRSPAYWEAVKHASAEAKRLGLEIGLHNTVGYSTTGGPWITEERAMKKLVWRKQIVLNNQSANLLIEKPDPVIDNDWGRKNLPPKPSTWYKDIAYLAIALADSTKFDNWLDVTAYFNAKGQLIKTLPKGDWMIYRLGYAPTMSTPHPVPDELITSCLESDKMSKAQSLFHWNKVLDPVKKELGNYLGNSFKHMLIDSYEAGYQNWTPDFREQFIKRKGYDPLPWILTFSPAVTNRVKHIEKKGFYTYYERCMHSEEETIRFDADYKDVINQLFFENGWEVGKKLLNDAKLQLQFEAYGGPFDRGQGSALADIPMGEFWSTEGLVNAQIPGAARAAGKTIIGAEAYTGSPKVSKYTEDPAFLKPQTTRNFAVGVNRMVLHSWVHQPFSDAYQPGMNMGWWGTHFSRFQTWAEPGKAFFNYLARTQVLLQYGEQSAVYLALESSADEQADIISKDDFLQQTIAVKKGKIVLSSGRSYPFIVLHSGNKILPEVLIKLQSLVKMGATIVGTKPIASSSLQNYPACDVQVATIANELWNNNELVFSNIKDAIEKFTLKPASRIEIADSVNLIKCLHRTGKNGSIYFVANLHKYAQAITMSFLETGLQPEIWNAENGTIKNAPLWKQENGRTLVQLSLNDFQSLFVVFRKTAKTVLHNYPTFIASKSELIDSINKNWVVDFHPQVGVSFKMNYSILTDFSLNEDKRVKYFAGKAVYSKSINVSSNILSNNKSFTIDFGQLNDIASVTINGKFLGVMWYPPYVMDVSKALKSGNNTIEISVTNNWANRLIGDEQEPADFEFGTDRGDNGKAMKAYPDWFLKNQPRPSEGRKAFSIWYYYKKDSKLEPAGLLGPVKLIGQNTTLHN